MNKLIVKNSNQTDLLLIEGIIVETHNKIKNNESYDELWYYNCISTYNKILITYTLNDSFGRNIQKRLPEMFFVLNTLYKKLR